MSSSPTDHPRSMLGWLVLRVLLVVETVLLAVLVVFSIIAALGDKGDPMQNLSLVVTAVLALVWVAVTAFGVVQSRAGWARGSSLTIHVLAFAGGTGCLQLAIGPWWLGWVIVLVALAGFFAAMLARPEARAIPEA